MFLSFNMRSILTFLIAFVTICSFGQGSISKGDSLFEKKKYSAALEQYKKATNNTSPSNKSIPCNNKAALCLNKLGQFDEAKSLLNRTLKQLKSNKSLLTEEALTNKLLGEVYLNTANYEKAYEYFQKELKLFTSQTLKETRATNLNNLGIVSDQLGNHDAAKEYIQQAILLQANSDDKIALANSYNNLGLVFTSENPKKALIEYQKALKIYKTEKGTKHTSYINTNNNIAIIYKKLGETDKALKIFETTLDTWLTIYGKNHPSIAFTYSNIAQVYLEFGKPEIALSYEEKALTIYKNTYGNNHPELANTYNHIANIHRSMKNYGAALISIQQSIIANCKEFKSKDLSSNPSPEQVATNRQLLAITLHLKAQLFADLHYKKTLKQSDLKLAFSTLESCDKIIDEQRHFLKSKKDKLALGSLSKEVDEDAIKIALAMADNSVTHKLDYFKKAFLFSEKSKAAVLLESMNDANAKSFSKLPKSILEEEKELTTAINLINQKIALGDQKEELKLRQELVNLTSKHNRLVSKLEKDFPEYYDLKYNIKMAQVEELQSTLSAHEMVLSFFISESNNRLYIFRISKSKFDIVNTTLSKNFNNTITGYRNGIFYQSDKDYIKGATRLHKKLFPKQLPKGISKLIIIPDGRLGVIPFESLLTKPVKSDSINFSKLPYLINDYAISYNFSATLYLQNRSKTKNNSKPSIVLAAPVNFKQLNALPGTKTEVNEIEKAFKAKGLTTIKLLEKKATETAIKESKIGKQTIIHFATHGIVNERKPEFSQIFLTKDSKNDGNLFTSEIYELQLDASLVNLSACETGLGQYSKGEGIVGLSRALIFAGAKNLIVSYWSVADESTSDLMISFYKEHLKNNNYDVSLRSSKQNLIADTRFNRPYYWAPFVLIGK